MWSGRSGSAVVGALAGLVLLTGCTSATEGSASRGSPEPARPDTAQGPDRELLSDERAAAISVESDIVFREVQGRPIALDICTGATPADTATRPAVLLIHGGGFVSGDKAGEQWRTICAWIADAGYVALSINYRLAPENPFPAAIEDVQAAVEWTRDNAATYGIDPERIGLLGGSAGASLAQLAGSRGEGSTTTGARVAAVVSLSGASDLTASGLELGTPTPSQVRNALNYLGCAEITACPQAPDASPITAVDPTDPPFLLAHAEQDPLPVEQTEAMAAALRAVGADPQVVIAPGRAHATRLLAAPRFRAAVLDFLAETLS